MNTLIRRHKRPAAQALKACQKSCSDSSGRTSLLPEVLLQLGCRSSCPRAALTTPSGPGAVLGAQALKQGRSNPQAMSQTARISNWRVSEAKLAWCWSCQHPAVQQLQ